MEVVKVLESKNRCLQRLLDLSVRFLQEGNFDGIGDFVSKRDSILKALDLYDRKISEVISRIPFTDRTPALIAAVQATLSEKDRIIQAIILKDNEITNQIEERKKKLQEEMVASRKSREVVGKFK